MEDDFVKLQSFILERQSENKPFFIGRLSGNETRLTGNILSNQMLQPDLICNMLYGAGISFQSAIDVSVFVKSYNSSVSKCDMLGIWTGNMREQAKEYYTFIDKMYPNLPRIAAQAMEPYYYMNNPQYNFGKIFKGKRVLIITSHYETTKHQLPKNDVLFEKPIFDPTTEFYVYKPPQQNGGNHDNESWIHHLEIMKRDLLRIKNKKFKFDIALVSCGGFGMIISNYIYSELSASAMYLGGALQIYFGIMGNRWNSNERILKHKNEHWTRPMEIDKPKNPQLCENNCYW